jgi:hypothetical protein
MQFELSILLLLLLHTKVLDLLLYKYVMNWNQFLKFPPAVSLEVQNYKVSEKHSRQNKLFEVVEVCYLSPWIWDAYIEMKFSCVIFLAIVLVRVANWMPHIANSKIQGKLCFPYGSICFVGCDL